MEKEIVYGVFAIDVELPKETDSKQELSNLAESMKSLNKGKMKKGRFVRAYKTLEDAVSECYDSNGWLISRKLEVPQGVTNADKCSFYYPMAIEINTEY
jgi:hypothetical protein